MRILIPLSILRTEILQSLRVTCSCFWLMFTVALSHQYHNAAPQVLSKGTDFPHGCTHVNTHAQGGLLSSQSSRTAGLSQQSCSPAVGPKLQKHRAFPTTCRASACLSWTPLAHPSRLWRSLWVVTLTSSTQTAPINSVPSANQLRVHCPLISFTSKKSQSLCSSVKARQDATGSLLPPGLCTTHHRSLRHTVQLPYYIACISRLFHDL